MIKQLRALFTVSLIWLAIGAGSAQALEQRLREDNLDQSVDLQNHNLIKGGVSVRENLNDPEEYLLPGGFAAKADISVDECLSLADKGVFFLPDHKPFRYLFRRGNLVLFPDHDTVVSTAFGDISIPKNTIVLLLHKKDSLAIYDLSKAGFEDVKFTRLGRTITCSPGLECIVASSTYKEMQNLPKILTAVSFRGYKKSSPDQASFCTYTTRFSITSAFQIMAPLNHLIRSNNERERRAFKQALKTFAVLVNMDPDGNDFPNSSLDADTST